MRVNDYSPLQAMWMQTCVRLVGAKCFSIIPIGLNLFSYGKCFFYSSILKNIQKQVFYRHECP